MSQSEQGQSRVSPIGWRDTQWGYTRSNYIEKVVLHLRDQSALV
jgi:hypothetical protein